MTNIIDSFKSIFKSSGNAISPQEAKQIQEKHLQIIKKKSLQRPQKTAPYLKIEEHIYDSNLQVAKCAVFNISQIAIKNKKYKAKIIDVLNKATSSKNITQDLQDYIYSWLEEIKASN